MMLDSKLSLVCVAKQSHYMWHLRASGAIQFLGYFDLSNICSMKDRRTRLDTGIN